MKFVYVTYIANDIINHMIRAILFFYVTVDYEIWVWKNEKKQALYLKGFIKKTKLLIQLQRFSFD